ncbi:MAG: EamA family transporter [Sebaldella sp.]|nr:EamA family transporter [Sebaldella sp.]
MKNRWLGIFMVVISAILWGISGTVSQYLFSVSTISVACVVSIRMFTAGVLLILISIYKGHKKKVIDILKDKNSCINIIIYSIFGMLGVQFTYFTAIAASNAAIATLLQYLAPIIVIIFYIIRLKQKIKLSEIGALFLALTGTFLLLTNGNTKTLTISHAALFWGVSSAFALAFYTVYVKKLLKWPSSIIIGWSMIIGGIILAFFVPDWNVLEEFKKTDVILSMIFIIILGTLVPFYFFIESLRYINPKEASLLSCSEPLASLIAAILWLHTEFGFYQFVGAFLIIVMILLLSLNSRKSR